MPPQALLWKVTSERGPVAQSLAGPWVGSPASPPLHPSTPACPCLCSSDPQCPSLFSQEEAQKQKELAKAEIEKILKEKEQLTADLSSMEKSFSDLFKRFEKQKEVIEGYRTVGGGEQACACPPPEGPWGAVVSPRPGLSCVLTLSRKLQSLHKDNSAGRRAMSFLTGGPRWGSPPCA